MMVKSARTKKFDDKIDLIYENRGLESLGYIQVDSIIYILIIVQSLEEFQAIQVMCSTWQIMRIGGEIMRSVVYMALKL